MRKVLHIVAGCVLAVAILVLRVVELLPEEAFFLFAGGTILYSAIWGKQAVLSIRVASTVLIYLMALVLCLRVRTMQVGFDIGVLAGAIAGYVFLGGLYGILPSLALWRIWPRPFGWTSFCAVFPVAFVAALVLAELEERAFARKYKTIGKGATARWTIPYHWLAYDEERQQLRGGD